MNQARLTQPNDNLDHGSVDRIISHLGTAPRSAPEGSRRSRRGEHEAMNSSSPSSLHPFGVPDDENGLVRSLGGGRRAPRSVDREFRRPDQESPHSGISSGISYRSGSLSPDHSWLSSQSSRSSTSSQLSTNKYAISRNSTGSTLAFPTRSAESRSSGKLPLLILSPEDQQRQKARIQEHLQRNHTERSPLLTKREKLEERQRLSDLDGRGNKPLPMEQIPEMVAAFDNLISGSVAKYVTLSDSIGPDVARQSYIVERLFWIQRDFLLSSCRNRTPSAGTGPAQTERLREIKNVAKERSDKSACSSHLWFIADTAGALGWVADRRSPSQFIRESYNRGKKHVRDIKKMRSSVQALHTEWIKAWQEVILDLEAFVNQWHPKGIIWGNN